MAKEGHTFILAENGKMVRQSYIYKMLIAPCNLATGYDSEVRFCTQSALDPAVVNTRRVTTDNIALMETSDDTENLDIH